jgi:hypothetical protein
MNESRATQDQASELTIRDQLEMFGLDATRNFAAATARTERQRARAIERVEVTHDIASSLPTGDDLHFQHAGLCQTFLPARRPASNQSIWRRTAGKFTLIVTPGVMDESDPTRRSAKLSAADEQKLWVGVPFGSTARLIMIYLQSEGMKSRHISLGSSLSAFLRALGLSVTGGKNGTIGRVREQALRIARCGFTMQFSDNDDQGDTRVRVKDTKVVDGFELWSSKKGDAWNATVELDERFHEHLKQHAVPLDKRALAHLSGNCLGLDLYALLGYRLPAIQKPVMLRWSSLQEQLGSSATEVKALARATREVEPDLRSVYPHANFTLSGAGILLKPSDPPVPRLKGSGGYRLIQASSGA